jgi:hypothetical protein
MMGRLGLGLAMVLLVPATSARADDQLEHLWPTLPADHALSLEDQITDHLTDIGNTICGHLDLLSHDVIGLHVNGRANRARLRVGGGNERYFLRIDSDWLFADGKARIDAKVDLALAGHSLELKLPAMDLSQDSYHGTQLVQINVPLLERTF